MSILGLGVDIVSISKIEKLYHRYPKKYPARILSDYEQQVFIRRKNAITFLASRYAAKEAFFKALGTGLRAPLTFQSVEVVSNNLGRPQLHVSSCIQAWLAQRDVKRICLSLSDTAELAVAVVVLQA